MLARASGSEKCCLKLLKEQTELPEKGRFIANVQFIIFRVSQSTNLHLPDGTCAIPDARSVIL
jgi:hypothetical protein